MFLPALFPVGWRERLCVCLCVWVHTRVRTCVCVHVKEIRKKRICSSWWRNLPSSSYSWDAIPSSWQSFRVEKSSDRNRFYVSTCCTNAASTCKFENKCKTHNYGKPLFKKGLRRIHSLVMDKEETTVQSPDWHFLKVE